MIDKEIKTDVQVIQDCINLINSTMSDLYKKGVEIRIAYKDSTSGAPNGIPCLELWRAIEHRDYLKERDNEQSTI